LEGALEDAKQSGDPERIRSAQEDINIFDGTLFDAPEMINFPDKLNAPAL